ncbi:MspA family porin [Rhodococcus sp. JG-3]|uniref:MspA family porin n=1 Tax=Rhodococcus sp. JG-3 TaxID=1305835 RepID=UPI000404C7C5|nr:MspA family porin [Rhodococcus sp. JG-3]
MTEIQKSRRSRGLKSMSVATVAGASVVGLVLGTGTASAGVDGQVSVVDAGGNTINVTLSDTFINGVPSLDGNPLTREWFVDENAAFTVTGPSADDFEGTFQIGFQVGYPLAIADPQVAFSWATPTLGLDIGSGNTSTGTLKTGVETANDTVEIDNPAYNKDLPESSTNPKKVKVPNPYAGQLVPSGESLGLEGVGEATSGIEFHADLLPTIEGSGALTPGGGIQSVTSDSIPITNDDDGQGSTADAAGTSGSIQVRGLHGSVTNVIGNVTVRPYVKVVSSAGDVAAVAYGQPVRFN